MWQTSFMIRTYVRVLCSRVCAWTAASPIRLPWHEPRSIACCPDLTTTDITGSTVKELRTLLDRLDLGITFTYNRFQKSGDHLLDGYPNGPAWLAANPRALRSEGHARKEHAELLDLLGSFGDSFHANRIGYAHIRILAPAVTEERRPLAVRDERRVARSGGSTHAIGVQNGGPQMGVVMRRRTVRPHPPRHPRCPSSGHVDRVARRILETRRHPRTARR